MEYIAVAIALGAFSIGLTISLGCQTISNAIKSAARVDNDEELRRRGY